MTNANKNISQLQDLVINAMNAVICPWMGKKGMGEDGLGVIRTYYIYCALYFLL